MPAALRLSVSDARKRLSEIVTHVQDPRGFCVLTRHGKPVAGIVSMAELGRIWNLDDIEVTGPRNPLTGHRTRRFQAVPQGMVTGPAGLLTYREAAEQVRDLQMDRAQEAALLRAGGLEPVPGGELALPPMLDAPRRRGWLARLFRRGGA